MHFGTTETTVTSLCLKPLLAWCLFGTRLTSGLKNANGYRTSTSSNSGLPLASARDTLLPLIADTAEFLPLRVPGHPPKFVLHPLLSVDLDGGAVVERNDVSGNITAIHKYIIRTDQLETDTHVFRVRQAPGSASRDDGLGRVVGCSFHPGLRKLCENNRLQGVDFELVFDGTDRHAHGVLVPVTGIREISVDFPP